MMTRDALRKLTPEEGKSVTGQRSNQLNGKALVTVGSFSMPHAHTVSVDSDTHLVYFPLQNIEGHPLLRIMEPNRTK